MPSQWNNDENKNTSCAAEQSQCLLCFTDHLQFLVDRFVMELESHSAKQ